MYATPAAARWRSNQKRSIARRRRRRLVNKGNECQEFLSDTKPVSITVPYIIYGGGGRSGVRVHNVPFPDDAILLYVRAPRTREVNNALYIFMRLCVRVCI